MEFCERCGGVIIVQGSRAFCANCNYKPKKKVKLVSSEKVNEKENIAVIKQEDNVYPIVEMRCLKCKNKKAYFWTQQTRSSDESETKFYKCTNCKHTWRVYR